MLKQKPSHENVSIGDPGFGFEKEDGHYIIPLRRRPHEKGVVIGEDVEIGAFTVIHRGRWRDTAIEYGTKIDSLVHIAHNVVIGKHTLVVAGSVLGGSCNVGDECFLGMNCSIKQGVTIGNHVTVGAGAVVLHDIPNGLTVVGNPAHAILNKGETVCRLCGLHDIPIEQYSTCPKCHGKLGKKVANEQRF